MKRITVRGGRLSLLGVATAVFVCAATIATVQTAGGPAADRNDRTRADAPPVADGSAQAEEQNPGAIETAEPSTVTIGGLRVGVDPKTGDLRPLTPAESARLAREMSRIFKPRELTRKQNPDGSLSAVVAPNVLRFSVARIDEDGTAAVGCAPGEHAAIDFMTGTQPAPATRPEEK